MEKRIISIALLIAAVSMAYYLIIYLPGRDNSEKMQRQQNSINLQTCLSAADTDYYDIIWKSYCKGDYKYCELPKELTDQVSTQRSKQREICFKGTPHL